jgi:hypothetical protein
MSTPTLDANGYPLQAGQRVSAKDFSGKPLRGFVTRVYEDPKYGALVEIDQFRKHFKRPARAADCVVQRGRDASQEAKWHLAEQQSMKTSPICRPRPRSKGNL